MKRKITILIALVILVLALGACSNVNEPPPPTNTPVPAEVEDTDQDMDGDDHQDADDDADADDGHDDDADTDDADSSDDGPMPTPINAQALWDANGCADCHGENREGDFAPPLLPDALTKDAGFYIGTITNGRGRMPVFGDKLTLAEIEALVEWLMTAIE